MANFIIVIDPNKKRRSSFIKAVASHISPVEGLTSLCFSNGNLCAIWSTGPWTPTSYLDDSQGFTMVLGEAIGKLDSMRVDAKQLREIWGKTTHALPEPFDGFHIALKYAENDAVFVGADLLGIFPVYYYVNAEILLVGSSPELFRYHPVFKTEFSPEGLVGILLTNGLIEGRTLWKGVKRLAAGHLLFWEPNKEPQEHLQYKIPVSERYFSLTTDEQLEILNEKISKAIQRHTRPNQKYTLLLSGGLDSRMLGGYLKKANREVIAVTEGNEIDLELKCARNVALGLGFEHQAINTNSEECAEHLEVKVKWEHLANGFSDATAWALYPYLRKTSPNVITGYLGDSILGGSGVDWGYSKTSKTISFETFFSNLNKWGFSPKVLNKLLKKEIFNNLVFETMTNIRRTYESYSELEFQRCYCFFLHTLSRFHVGGMVWPLTFGAWPVLPFIDKEILEVIGGLPLEAHLNRYIQKQLLCKEHSELSKLPLDRCSYDTTPLKPTVKQQLVHYAYGDATFLNRSRHFRQLRKAIMNLNGEKRYYLRKYDFNNKAWRTIREQVEKYGNKQLNLFYEKTLETLFPNSNVKINFADQIRESSSLKILIGFQLWSELDKRNLLKE